MKSILKLKVTFGFVLYYIGRTKNEPFIRFFEYAVRYRPLFSIADFERSIIYVSVPYTCCDRKKLFLHNFLYNIAQQYALYDKYVQLGRKYRRLNCTCHSCVRICLLHFTVLCDDEIAIKLQLSDLSLSAHCHKRKRSVDITAVTTLLRLSPRGTEDMNKHAEVGKLVVVGGMIAIQRATYINIVHTLNVGNWITKDFETDKK